MRCQVQGIQKQEARFIRMTQEPVKRLILSMSVPTIISMMISSLYNMVDTYFVSKLGTSATAAVGVTFSLMAIIQAVGFTFGMGAGSYISRLLGQKRNEEADRVAVTALLASAACGLVIMVFGLVFIDRLMYLLGATPTILPYARAYARYILIGAPYMTASFVMNNLLRSEGSAALSMVGIAAGAVINTALDPLFIFVLDMGTGGAALATIISQLVSFCILLWMLLGKRSNLTLRLRNFSFKWPIYREVLKMGSPSFFRQILASVASICLNAFAGPFGDFAIAAMSIVSRVMFFLLSFMLGFGQAFTPVAGYSYGARRFDRLWEAYWFCVCFGAGVVSFFGVFVFVFAPRIVSAFQPDDLDVVRTATLALRVQSVTLPLQAFVISSNMLFQATGKGLHAAVLSLCRQGLFFIPIIFLFSRYFGLFGVQISQMSSDVASFILAVPLALGFLKQIAAQRALLGQNAGAPRPSESNG